jgi:hypothetical protein
VKDELATIGEAIPESELVQITLKGFTKEWEIFVKCVVGREKLLDWSRLWDNFTQEEIREGTQEKSLHGADNKNVALVVKGNEKKKDMSKAKCFACHKTDHYASQCLNRKKKKLEPEVSASVEVAEFAERYEKEFSLMIGPVGSVCLVFEDIESWLVDSGASRLEVSFPRFYRDRLRLQSELWSRPTTCSKGGWKGEIPTRVRRFSGGFRGVIYSRVDC